jgi:hypothetical protein
MLAAHSFFRGKALPMAEAPDDSKPELTERERKFLTRITNKYQDEGPRALIKSLLIFSAIITAGHLIERSPLPWWGAFLAVYCPAIFLFSRYRRFNIFKSRLLRKLFLIEQAGRSAPTTPAQK